ncbi:MAG: hypothetical protein R6X35_06105 [Candidatus Krumholzibacteriia bacterium]
MPHRHARALALPVVLTLALALCAGCASTRRAWLPGQWERLTEAEREKGVELRRGHRAIVLFTSGRQREAEVLATGPDWLVFGGPGNYGLRADTLRAGEIADIGVQEPNDLGQVGAYTLITVSVLGIAFAAIIAGLDLGGLD